MTDNFADVNGVRLHYVEQGTGPLIIFLHGFPEFWYEWKNQLEEFGRDHHAVAPDMRGYNLSSKPEGVESYKVKILVEDIKALAANLGASKFILVGHDWGGVVAWAFALQHPEQLHSLVIVNAPHPAIFQRELEHNPAQQKASAYMLMFRSEQGEATLSAGNYAALVNAVMGEGLKQGHFTEEDKDVYIDAWSRPGALTGGLNYYRAAKAGPGGGSFSVDPAKLTVHVPVLVIWGEQDKALLATNLDGMEEFVPDLKIVRIADGTHWVIHERPAQVNAAIRDFLAEKHVDV